jgi:hypothetical protein
MENIVEKYMENKSRCWRMLLNNIWKTNLDLGKDCWKIYYIEKEILLNNKWRTNVNVVGYC